MKFPNKQSELETINHYYEESQKMWEAEKQEQYDIAFQEGAECQKQKINDLKSQIWSLEGGIEEYEAIVKSMQADSDNVRRKYRKQIEEINRKDIGMLWADRKQNNAFWAFLTIFWCRGECSGLSGEYDDDFGAEI